MQRQISEFLRICKVDEAIINGETQQDELTFTIDVIDITLVRLSPKAYCFEVDLLDLPVSYSDRIALLSKLLNTMAVHTYLSDAVVSINKKNDKVVLQKLLSPKLRSGLEIVQSLMRLLETQNWWYQSAGFMQSRKGPDRSSRSSSPSNSPVIFG